VSARCGCRRWRTGPPTSKKPLRTGWDDRLMGVGSRRRRALGPRLPDLDEVHRSRARLPPAALDREPRGAGLELLRAQRDDRSERVVEEDGDLGAVVDRSDLDRLVDVEGE